MPWGRRNTKCIHTLSEWVTDFNTTSWVFQLAWFTCAWSTAPCSLSRGRGGEVQACMNTVVPIPLSPVRVQHVRDQYDFASGTCSGSDVRGYS